MDVKIRYFNNDNTILSELFRLEQFQKILLEVKKIYTTKFNTTLDSFKNKKINAFVSLWIMNQFDNIDICKIRSIILNWGNEIWTWQPAKLPLLEEWILKYNDVPVLELSMFKVWTMLHAGFIVDIGMLEFMSTR